MEQPAKQRKGLLYLLATLLRGLFLICPHCTTGRMFRTMFEMYPVCPDCGVVFERDPGEVTGGMGINISVTLTLFMIGFVLTIVLLDLSVPAQLILWTIFMILFPIGFYPSSRGLWVAILYLTGHVYRS